jgi:hypothetical protein
MRSKRQTARVRREQTQAKTESGRADRKYHSSQVPSPCGIPHSTVMGGIVQADVSMPVENACLTEAWC